MSFTTAVIGAGAAGISATLAMRSVGSMVTCFEATDTVGGVWNYNGNDGSGTDRFQPGAFTGSVTPIHPSLRCALPKDMMAFSDMRFPFQVQQFPHYGAVQQYLKDYAAGRGMHSLTRFNTLVEKVEWNPDRRQWAVRTVNVRNGDVMAWWFDSVVVATGRFHRVRMPLSHHTGGGQGSRSRTMGPVPGQLAFEEAGGVILHSSDTKRFREFRGQNVVVVGRGVAAAECVKELRRHGAFAVHSVEIDRPKKRPTGSGTQSNQHEPKGNPDAALEEKRSSLALRMRRAIAVRMLAGGYLSITPRGGGGAHTPHFVARVMHAKNVRYARLPLSTPSPVAIRAALLRKAGAAAKGHSEASGMAVSDPAAGASDLSVYGSSPGFIRMPSLGAFVGFAGAQEYSAAPLKEDNGTESNEFDHRTVFVRFPESTSRVTRQGDVNPVRSAGHVLLSLFEQQGLIPKDRDGAVDGWSPLQRHVIRAAAREAALSEALSVAGITPTNCAGEASKVDEGRGVEQQTRENVIAVRNVSAVVFCTGYYQSFPFLDDAIRSCVESGSRRPPIRLEQRNEAKEDNPSSSQVKAEDQTPPTPLSNREKVEVKDDAAEERLPLFKHMYLGCIYQHNPTIAFVGLPGNLTPPFALMEAQARFVSYVLARRAALPSTPTKMDEREQRIFGLLPGELADPSGCGVTTSALLYDALLREIAGEFPLVDPKAQKDGDASPTDTVKEQTTANGQTASNGPSKDDGPAAPCDQHDSTHSATDFSTVRLTALRRSYYWDHMGWQRFWWYAGTSFVSSIHKARSFAPLKRREHHVIISNEI